MQKQMQMLQEARCMLKTGAKHCWSLRARKTSVAHRALRDGASLFDDEKKWAAYFSYNLKLWAMALIALAITDARILGNIKNWDAEDISHSVRRPC